MRNKFVKFFPILFIFIFTILGWQAAHFFVSTKATAEDIRLDEQEASITSIKKVIPAVASIVVYDTVDMVGIDIFTGAKVTSKDKVQKGSGTGFLISADGLILTNKHVVNSANEKTGEYRVILNSGKQYYAQLIGKDPVNDLAVLKIFDKNLPYIEIGDSDKLQLGTTVIAIGNTLGRYQNSVTKGIISGLGRSLYASDSAGNAESLDNVIQTDANINPGNSGGPLIDLYGKVVGINVAIDEAGDGVGFAIPINDARQVIKSIRESGRIIRARLGVQYIMVTPQIAQDNKLSRTSGAWVTKSKPETATVVTGSPAEKAGILENDIIFEINGIKLEGNKSLLSLIERYKPGDKLGLKIQRGDRVIIKTVQLDEFK